VSWKFYRRAPQRFADHFQQQPYYIELHQRKVSTTATLSVNKGKAIQDRFTIRSGSSVTIGRQAEVTDERGRMVRRNVVAFLDYEDQRLDEETRQIHESISRVHARISYHEADAAFRLYDDQSTWGTSVVRDGCLVPFQVRQQPVALQHGDLIYIGKACLRFTNGKR
jgi:pSer/pThr/pTyr-binding forkhead associated (FHA) protein